MKKIGDHVAEGYRNPDSISDLEYPYTFAPNIEQYLIWHRDTGEIVWTVNRLGEEAYREARKICYQFNGWEQKDEME